MDSDEYIGVTRVLTELKNYAPFVLPTLLIFAVESRTSLKYWHAVQQLPAIEPEPSANTDDAEANVDKARQAEIVKMRKAVAKEARRTVLGCLGIAITLIAIASFEQLVAIKGMISRRTRDGDEFDPLVYDEPGVENDSEDWYSWYYNSSFGQLDWAEYYYAVVLLFPAIFMIARSLYLFSGLKDRIILRNSNNTIFMITGANTVIRPRHPLLVTFVIILSSILLATGALWSRSNICAIILYMSLVHFSVSVGSVPKVMYFKIYLMTALFMPMILGSLVFTKTTGEPIRLIYFTPLASNTDWSALIFSAVGSSAFNFIALCYRLDHSLARPDELIVGPPDTEVVLRDVSPVRGTRLTYAHSHSAASSRFAKPYFHAAVWGWLVGYVVMAALGASGFGYLACTAESAGFYGLYVHPPLMVGAVMIRALLRGDVRKLLAYKEEWAKAPEDTEVSAVPLKVEESLEEKMSISEPEINEKSVLEA